LPGELSWSTESKTMKLKTIILTAMLALSGTFAFAQRRAPSGRGSTTGDPAASSATPGTSPTTGSSMKPNRSGSGTSTSGGSDANGDQGRDKMPDSSPGVRPLNKQGKPDRMLETRRLRQSFARESRRSPCHHNRTLSAPDRYVRPFQ